MNKTTTPKGATSSSGQIATLRIELAFTDPAIWREVEVPTAITLKALHDIVQAAMGWTDCHLWEMRIGEQAYGLDLDDMWCDLPSQSATKVHLSDLLARGETRIDYTYDFGDSWEHSLTFSDLRSGEPDTSYPRLIAGEGNCPPEDCGGVPGFYDILEIRGNPKDPDHAEVTEWLGDYDPDRLDAAAIHAALARLQSQPKASATPSTRKRKG